MNRCSRRTWTKSSTEEASAPRFWPLIDKVGVCSGIALPLRANGQLLGSLLLARDRSGEPFTEEDVLVAQELGTRAAIAIRNARNVAALELSEAMYRGLADSTPASVVVTAPDGSIEYANRFFLDYAGVTYEQLCDRGYHELVHPADLAHVVPSRDAAIEAGGEFVCEYRMRRHDGVYRWNFVRIVPIFGDHRRAARVLRVVVDIDDRHRAEERQRLLMEASQLAAQPFDFDAVLERIVSIVVPGLADGADSRLCFKMRSLSWPHSRVPIRKKNSLLRRVIDASLPNLHQDFGLGRALVTGEARLLADSRSGA